MIGSDEGKRGSSDPAVLERMIELEMQQKRLSWKEASARARKIRVASFVFLFLVIVGAVFGFFLLFSSINQQRMEQGPHRASSAANP